MKTISVRRKLFGLIPYTHKVERPHIWKGPSPARIAPRYKHVPRCYTCEGGGHLGFGITPLEAWNDWAMWALI